MVRHLYGAGKWVDFRGIFMNGDCVYKREPGLWRGLWYGEWGYSRGNGGTSVKMVLRINVCALVGRKEFGGLCVDFNGRRWNPLSSFLPHYHECLQRRAKLFAPSHFALVFRFEHDG